MSKTARTMPISVVAGLIPGKSLRTIARVSAEEGIGERLTATLRLYSEADVSALRKALAAKKMGRPRTKTP